METFVGIGDRLKEERERLGVNQTEFAALAGVSKNSQFNYEKGERSPDAAYLATVAAAGVDVLYILTGQRSAPNETALTTEESAVLNDYRSMPGSDRAAVRRMTSALAESAGRYQTKK